MKYVLLLTTLFLCFGSCSIHHTISSLSIETTIGHDPLAVGDIFAFQITAIDNDGVVYVSIDIEELGIHEEYTPNAETEWFYEREILIPGQENAGMVNIIVHIKDNLGNEKHKITTLNIQKL